MKETNRKKHVDAKDISY